MKGFFNVYRKNFLVLWIPFMILLIVICFLTVGNIGYYKMYGNFYKTVFSFNDALQWSIVVVVLSLYMFFVVGASLPEQGKQGKGLHLK